MAALVRLLYRNYGLAATWSATTAVATLPASNLASPKRQTKCRTTSITAQRFVADFGEAVTLGAVAIATHNFTSAASLAIKMNAADAWGAPAFSTTLTAWDDKDSNVLLKFFDAAQTYRYLAIEPTDAANPDGYFEMGVPVLSPVFSFGDAPNDLRLRFVDPSPVSYAPAGTPHTEERVVFAEVEMDWRLLTEAMVFGDLQTVLRYIGRKRDLVLSTFSTAPSADDISKSLNLYGRLVEIPEFEALATANGNRYNWGPVVFRESL